MIALFILAFLFVFYTYLGYPLLLLVRRRRRESPPLLGRERLPSISLLIPVFNEEEVIAPKILNSLELDYPPEKLEIVVVSDGSEDKTDQIVRGYCARGIKFISNPIHRGKMSVINQVMPQLTGEIVVFTDASALFSPDVLLFLVAPLADPSVGAVSGELVLREEETAEGPIRVDWYWRWEKFIRKMEGELSSCSGATGAIYALRRRLFRPLPGDTILDDLLIPLQVIQQGYRIVFESRAKAYEENPADLAVEFRRKVRTLIGNYQVFSRNWELFLPGKSKVAFNLISHKLLRLFVPPALILLLITSAAGGAVLRPLFCFQLVFYLLAGIGLIMVRQGEKPVKVFSLPLTFCLLNAAAFWAFWLYFFRKRPPLWR